LAGICAKTAIAPIERIKYLFTVAYLVNILDSIAPVSVQISL